jgi:putative tricarboxylic transport membrane protein
MLFENHPEIVSAIFIIMALANLIFLFIGLIGARVISKIINIRMGLLLPIISLFCFIGAYSNRNSLFDVGVMILFGAIGYLFNKGNFPSAPLVLGLILGR